MVQKNSGWGIKMVHLGEYIPLTACSRCRNILLPACRGWNLVLHMLQDYQYRWLDWELEGIVGDKICKQQKAHLLVQFTLELII